jgi:hypothetical protein
MVFDPIQIGYVRRGGAEAPSAVATLGRSDGARAFLRFSVPLAPEANVLEAYLLIHRVPGDDSDPRPVSLHAARVVGPWDERHLSWAVQPRFEEVGAPVTRVTSAAGTAVRLDVGAIVEQWRRAARDDLGVAIVAEAAADPDAGPTETGLPFALAPGDAVDGPRLELYVR